MWANGKSRNPDGATAFVYMRPLSTGSAAGWVLAGGCRSRWRRRSASRPHGEPVDRYGTPRFHTDQGSSVHQCRVTGRTDRPRWDRDQPWTAKGRWRRDNVFVERCARRAKRGGLPARIRHGEEPQRGLIGRNRLLQLASTTFEFESETAGSGVLQPGRRFSRRPNPAEAST